LCTSGITYFTFFINSTIEEMNRMIAHIWNRLFFHKKKIEEMNLIKDTNDAEERWTTEASRINAFTNTLAGTLSALRLALGDLEQLQREHEAAKTKIEELKLENFRLDDNLQREREAGKRKFEEFSLREDGMEAQIKGLERENKELKEAIEGSYSLRKRRNTSV